MSKEELEKKVNELERRVNWLYQMLAKQTKVNDMLINGLSGLTNTVQTNTEILEHHTKLFHDITHSMKD